MIDVSRSIVEQIRKSAEPLSAMQLAELVGESLATTAKTLVQLREDGKVSQRVAGDRLVYMAAN